MENTCLLKKSWFKYQKMQPPSDIVEKENLESANLQGADLSGAFLIGANLNDANMEGCIGSPQLWNSI